MSKSIFCAGFGVFGSFIAMILGGWDSAIETLLIFMLVDYVTGLIVAGVFKKSPKTKTGALESNTGFKGIIKKCMILVFVMIGYRLDIALSLNYIRNAVVISFITNELISIIENAGLMGLPVPKVIINAIDILKQKGEE